VIRGAAPLRLRDVSILGPAGAGVDLIGQVGCLVENQGCR
jgi:hypothetical protein